MAKDSRGQVEKLFQEIGKKIDQVIVDVKDAKDDVRDEVEKKITTLKKKKEKLENEFKEAETKEKWHDAKSHFVAAAKEIKKAVESALK